MLMHKLSKIREGVETDRDVFLSLESSDGEEDEVGVVPRGGRREGVWSG